MSQFAREDSQAAIDFVSDGDVVLESDRNQDGVGDLVFRTGGVERARIDHAGVGTGWANVLGGSITDLKQLGGKGDGTTDDTAAVTAAEASADIVFTAPGTYKTTLAATALTGRFRGVGQVQDVGGHNRAPWFSAVSAAPSSKGTWSSVTTAFDGDLSKVQIAMEHRVTGAATLGRPTSGYVDNQEAAPINVYLYNESGWNNGTADNTGRTEVAAFYSRVYQNGQGDLACFNANGFVTGAKVGATSFLANPAATLFNGQLTAGHAGVYMNPLEVTVDDGGFDAAAIGLVLNMKRTANTGALDVLWGGVRVANTGSQAVDVGFMLKNGGSGDGFSVGLDLAAAGLATTGTWVSAAITLAADQRIYLNATGSDAGSSIYRRPSSTGTTYIKYDTGITGINIVVGNSSALQLKSNLVTSAQNFQVASGKTYQVSGTQVVTARQTGWASPTGTLSRATFDQSTVTLAALAQRVAALITDLTTHGLIGA